MNKFVKQAITQATRVQQDSKSSSLDHKLQLALKLHQEGNIAGAANLYGEILAQEPNHFDALHLLAVAAHQTGNSHGALTLFDKAIAINPNVADVYTNRSSALMDLERYAEALESCQKAIELNKLGAEIWFNTGNALSKLGRADEACQHYEKAVKLRPDFVHAWTNLGHEQLELGLIKESIDSLTSALKHDPYHSKAVLNLGSAYLEAGNIAEAEIHFLKALEIDPAYTKALVNLSNIAFSSGRLTEALTFAERALKAGFSIEVGNALGNCYRALGRPLDAIEIFRRAVQVGRLNKEVHSNLLLTLQSDPDTSLEQASNEATHWAAAHAPWKVTSDWTKGQFKRIGFVSGDLRQHPVGLFLEPLLMGLKDVEVTLYANQVREDDQSQRLRELCHSWQPIRNKSTKAVVDMINGDQIDILVDLSGHTADGRLDVFAESAAPIQITWLGYPGTTGMSQFDALLADQILVPWNHEEQYAELVARLPNCFTCSYFAKDLPDVSPPPVLENGKLTFGSFNATTKLNDEVLSAWARILTMVPQSRLMLKNLFLGDPMVQSRVLETLVSAGIDAGRVHFLGQTSSTNHFEAFSQIDVMLDPFPYGGATTTLDCLWMGVPVVTMLGDRYAGRMSASLLSAVGLDNLVSESVDDYCKRAIELATDLEALAVLRSSIRGQIEASPLCDHEQFASDFLSVLSDVWSSKLSTAA